MTEIDPTLVKDKTVRLIVLGIFDLILAGLCIIAVVFAGSSPRAIDMDILFSVFAVTLGVLGIGSILRRRWSRTLMLVLAWTWLVFGIVWSTYYSFTLPRRYASIQLQYPTFSPDKIKGTVIAECIVFFILFLLLPLLFVLLYGSRKAKDTVEKHDPIPRWTDKKPLSVLTLCFWSVLSALLYIDMLFVHNVVYGFGHLMTGIPAGLINLGLSLWWLVLAIWVYRQEVRGWYAVLVTDLVLVMSGVITYWQVSITELHSQWHFTASELELMTKFEAWEKRGMLLSTGVGVAILLGFLLYVRQHFPRSKPQEPMIAPSD